LRKEITIATTAIALIAVILSAALLALAVNPPAVHQVVIKSYGSNDQMLQALQNGDLDIAVIENAAPSILTQLRAESNLSVTSIPSFSFTYIGLNLRNPPLNNLTFRQAMLYGFDRQNALRKVLAGYGEILNPSLFSSAYGDLGWRNSSVDPYPYNPSKAGRLLDSLGYTGSPGELRIDPSTGQTLRTMFIFSRLSDPESVAVANLFAKDMRAIGLPVINFPATDIDFFANTKATYYFDMYIDTVTPGPGPSWLGRLFAGYNDLSPAPLSPNLVGYHSHVFDENFEELMNATDLNAAHDAAYRCQEQLGFDVPALPVFSKNIMLVTRQNSTQIVPITGSLEDTLVQTLTQITSGTTVVGEPPGLSTIDPSLAMSPADLLALKLVSEPLFESNTESALLPGLASEWHLSDNSTMLSIVLRQGVTFGDGSPITSHDLAQTIDWLMRNVIPSSPFYEAINSTKSVVEVDSRTVSITLRQPDSLAANQFANLFALPANLLPPANPPLGLLTDGSFVSSGAFNMVRFIQGNEVDLAYNDLLPNGDWVNPNTTNLNGVQGQTLSGATTGGSQIRLFSQSLTYQDEQIGNASLTTRLFNSNGELQATSQGSYFGFGVYESNLNLNNQTLSPGSYRFTTTLYANLPSGVIIQFGEGTLRVNPPLFFLQLILYLVTLAAVLGVIMKTGHRGAKRRVSRRSTRRRKSTVSRVRRRK